MSPAHGPVDVLQRNPLALPEVDAIVVRAGHDAHTPGRGIETRVQQETAEIVSQIVSPHVQPYQAVSGVTELGEIKIFVLREESDVSLPVQERDNVIILRPPVAQMDTNLPKRNPPPAQHHALVFRKVLVEQIQAATAVAPGAVVPATSRPPLSSQARRESLTASATAVNGIRPPHLLLQMKSQERPSATSSSTCQTMMRVPLNVGLPWQTSGSATMYWPNSSRRDTGRRARFLPVLMLQNYRGADYRSS